MRRGLTSILLLTAVSAVLPGSAFAATSNSILLPGFVEAVLNGGFAPAELPAHERAPVSLALTERIRSQDGSRPSALQELEVELDRHLAFSVKGLPRCPAPLRSRQSRTETLPQCEKAKVGSGAVLVDVAFLEEPPVQVRGTLSIYNGGVRDRRTTFWLYTYLPAPVAGTILAPLRFRRETRGPFGSSGALTMPKIAGGYASVTYLGLRFRKGIFAASCPTGKSPGRATAHLVDGTVLICTYTQTCRASVAATSGGLGPWPPAGSP